MKIIMLLLFLLVGGLLYSLDFVLIEPRDEEQVLSAFYVSTVQVTQQLFRDIMGFNPSFFRGDSLPVESLSWYEAIVFCNRLSIVHHLTPVYIFEGTRYPDEWGEVPNHTHVYWSSIQADTLANGFRLMTNAEWYYLYDLLKDELHENIEEYAWIHTNSENRTQVVGTKSPDKLGLYDFLGNVYEWRFDSRGNIPNDYFSPRTQEARLMVESLSFDIMRSIDFMISRDDVGFWTLIRNRRVGLRVVRNME